MVISLSIAWNEPRKVSISIPYVLCSLSKQEVFAPTSCWVTFDPAESSILPGRTCCVLTLVNIIPKFPKKNHKFLYELSSKFSRFYVSICMVIKKCKVSLKTLWIKKWRMWGFSPKSYNGGRDILSGEWSCVLWWYHGSVACVPGSSERMGTWDRFSQLPIYQVGKAFRGHYSTLKWTYVVGGKK